jgi:hypothetical protein
VLIEPVKVLLPLVAPIGQPVKEKRTLAFGLADAPTAEKLPKVSPVAVGTGVGSVVPDVAVTLPKPYVPVKL